MKLGKYSLGIGDRFGKEGKAQLAAIQKAKQKGVPITPVWNKSYREHQIIGTCPGDVRVEADASVKSLGWKDAYFVDADHINKHSVDLFIESSDFFTIDVADVIGHPASKDKLDALHQKMKSYLGTFQVPGIDTDFNFTEDTFHTIANTYLTAIEEAGNIYRHIQKKKKGDFIIEVSMDETEMPQTPLALFIILGILSEEHIPVETIAPKFSGQFNKGIDYEGDVSQFMKEFEENILIIDYGIQEFGLPPALKLSIHSGSDKFSLYGPVREVIKKHDAGIHLKTAGTTWLEELIGLAEAGGEGLLIAKAIYKKALGRYDELCAPYATVIDIDRMQLPSPEEVETWDCERFTHTLRHDPHCPDYNPHFRQLLHIAYKIAAEMGDRFREALRTYEEAVHKNVTQNLFERHILPLFG